MSIAVISAGALAAVQVASAVKEIYDLFAEGEITEEQFVKRMRNCGQRLTSIDAEWEQMEQAEKHGTSSDS